MTNYTDAIPFKPQKWPAMEGEVVLALNCAGVLGPDGPMPLEGVIHLDLSNLTAALLQQIGPSVVIVPLFTADHDATTAIEALVALAYAGRVTVLAPQLPNPKLVERELRGLGLQVTLISP